jgi:hypothetical protein
LCVSISVVQNELRHGKVVLVLTLAPKLATNLFLAYFDPHFN